MTDIRDGKQMCQRFPLSFNSMKPPLSPLILCPILRCPGVFLNLRLMLTYVDLLFSFFFSFPFLNDEEKVGELRILLGMGSSCSQEAVTQVVHRTDSVCYVHMKWEILRAM